MDSRKGGATKPSHRPVFELKYPVSQEDENHAVSSWTATDSVGSVLRMMKNSSTVKNLPLSILQPHWDHQLRWSGFTDDDLRLIESMERFGVLEPIAVEEGTYRIVKGHRRYGAAKAIGLSCVPCVVRPKMNEGEYELLRFMLQETWKPLTKQQVRRACRRLQDHGFDVAEDLLLAA